MLNGCVIFVSELLKKWYSTCLTCSRMWGKYTTTVIICINKGLFLQLTPSNTVHCWANSVARCWLKILSKPKLNSSQHYPTLSNIIQHHPTSSNIIQHYPTLSNIIQHHPTLSNIIQHYPTSSNIIQHYPTLSNIYGVQTRPTC